MKASTYDASYAQQQFWPKYDRTSGVQNLLLSFRITGSLDVLAMQLAINEIVRRHEILRTVLAEIAGRLQQIVQPDLFIPLVIQPMNWDTSADAVDEHVARLIEPHAAQPFDLETGPLLRAGLIILGPNERVLFLVVHHLVFDRWSAAVFLEELSINYDAYVRNAVPDLPVLPLPYRSYATCQKEWLIGQECSRRRTFWREALRRTLAPIELHTNGRDVSTLSDAGAQIAFSLTNTRDAELV
jgi:hypothetical protein